MKCSPQDVAILVRLFRKYVSLKDALDIPRLQSAVRREARAAERKRVNVTRGLLRELRHDRDVVGRIAKRCQRSTSAVLLEARHPRK